MAEPRAGIDEAGKGSLLGDLVIAMVICSPEQEQKLLKAGVKDSKKLSAVKRNELEKLIREESIQIETYSISSAEIDSYRKSGKNLNEIELDGFKNLFSRCKNPKNTKLFLDSFDVNCPRLKGHFEASEVISEHRADDKYPCVAAASIIAKTARDRSIELIKNQVKKECPCILEKWPLGSGYPSDIKTRNFVLEWYRRNGSFPNFARTSWKTCSNLIRLL